MSAKKKPRYTYEGAAVPSVTEILSLLAKPALVPWAAKITAEACQQYIYDHGAHDPLDGTVTLTAEDVDSMVAESKKAHRAASKKAMEHGTAVHEAIDNWIASGGTMSPEEISDESVRQGLVAFLEYGESVDLQILASEQEVFGWATQERAKAVGEIPLYAGRFDLLARINGRLTMCDFKVSTGVWDEYWLQLSAYARAWEQTGQEIPVQLAVFRIDKETGLLEPHYRGRNYDGYMAFWHLAQYRRSIEKLMEEQWQ